MATPTKTTVVPVWHIHRGGERIADSCVVACDWHKQLSEIQAAGLCFTAEILRTGHVNLCLEHPDYGDFMSRIADNRPCDNTPAIVLFNMLRDWSHSRLQSWIAAAEA